MRRVTIEAPEMAPEPPWRRWNGWFRSPLDADLHWHHLDYKHISGSARREVVPGVDVPHYANVIDRNKAQAASGCP